MFYKKSLTVFLAGVAVAISSAEKEATKESKVLSNPFEFSFQQNKKGTGYIPSSSQAVPRGIKVVAIVDMGKKGIMGALRTAEGKNSFYVKKGDVIRVDKMRDSKNSKAKTSDEVVYLEIVDLSKSEVTIAPKQRPDAKVILR